LHAEDHDDNPARLLNPGQAVAIHPSAPVQFPHCDQDKWQGAKPTCPHGAPEIYVAPVAFSDNGMGLPLIGVQTGAVDNGSNWTAHLVVITQNAGGSGRCGSAPALPTDSSSRSRNAHEGEGTMKTLIGIGAAALVLLAHVASADSTAYLPVATGFTLPDGQQAVSATSLTGTLGGSQIVGNVTNVGVVRASGNIVAGGNVTATGYVNGSNGLYSGNGVYATDYYGRSGSANANFNGNASSATTATSATSANYATTSGSANYAASTNIGILYQNGSGDGSSYYCDSGYHLVFYDTNVNSTNNAFFYELQNGH